MPSIRFASVILSTLFTSCSTSSINIQSFPDGAEIYVKPVGKNEAKLIGKTPYSTSGSTLERENGTSGPVLIELRKEGFQTNQTLVTELQNVELSLNIPLSTLQKQGPQTAPGAQSASGTANNLDDHEKLNGLLDLLFKSQHLARRGSYDEALNQAKSVQKEAPQLSAAYEIEGGIYYLQKKYKEALSAYTEAVKYNPKNIESLKMRTLLETALHIKPSMSVQAPDVPKAIETTASTEPQPLAKPSPLSSPLGTTTPPQPDQTTP